MIRMTHGMLGAGVILLFFSLASAARHYRSPANRKGTTTAYVIGLGFDAVVVLALLSFSALQRLLPVDGYRYLFNGLFVGLTFTLCAGLICLITKQRLWGSVLTLFISSLVLTSEFMVA